jgi:hypothetical protein
MPAPTLPTVSARVVNSLEPGQGAGSIRRPDTVQARIRTQ